MSGSLEDSIKRWKSDREGRTGDLVQKNEMPFPSGDAFLNEWRGQISARVQGNESPECATMDRAGRPNVVS